MPLLLLPPTGGGGGGSSPVDYGLFDAVNLPKFHVWAGVGAGGALQDISVDSTGRYAIRSISRSFGRSSPIDSADPATLNVVFNNYWSGDYDPAGVGFGESVPLFTADPSDTSPTVNYSISGQTSASSSGCTNSIVTAVTGGVLHDAGNAAAATPNGTSPAAFPGPQTFWNDTPNGGTYNWESVRQRIRIDTDQVSGVGLYYAHQGATTAANGVDFSNPWYQGLQANGALGGKCWNASVWNAVDAVAGDLPGTYAGPFSGEGEGYQLQAQFAWVAGRTYTLQMIAEPTRGPRWFAFWIKDETTAATTRLGSIRAATTDASFVRGICYNFTELFSQSSPATTCPLLPRATTFFSAPIFSAATAVSGALTVGTPVELRVEWPAGTNVTKYVGAITSVVLDAGDDPTVTVTAADGLVKLGRTELPAGLRTFVFHQSGDRIFDLADEAGWTGPRAIDLGAATLWPTQELGSTAFELMRLVEMTEMGTLFVAEDGTLTFWDRYHTSTATRSTTSQLTLTDSGSAGTVGMMELISSRDLGRVHNDVHITRNPDPTQDPQLTGTEPGDEPSEQIARDWVSIGTSPDGSNHGFLNLPAEVGKLHASDAAALDQATMLLSWYSTPQDRIEQVTINLLHPKIKAENLFADLLALTILDRISVSRNYGPRTISGQLLIEKIEEEINADPPTWQIRLTTSNPTPPIPRFIVGVHNPDDDLLGW